MFAENASVKLFFMTSAVSEQIPTEEPYPFLPPVSLRLVT